MIKIRNFLSQELTGWSKIESLFFTISIISILLVSILSKDTLYGTLSSITGVMYTLCNGKGKRSAYIFGFINSILFAVISFQNTIYGDAMLYGFFYIPAMIVGFVSWNGNLNTANFEIKRKKMNALCRICLLIISAALVFFIGYALSYSDDALPYIDSFTVVIQIIATILAICRYIEQWILWTAVNVAEVILWSIRLSIGAQNAAVSLVMFVCFLIIGIKMWAD